MSAKKKQEEKHLKLLKAMQQLEFNKKCFDCDQRGPTYIDVTIGSFVCTSCGGVLRGLNPPHRVKSISMATFTPAEILFMESRGNEFCRNIYLGKYDAKMKPRPDTKDHAKLKFFMEQKYEQKRWYVPPDQAQKSSSITAKAEATKPLETLLGSNTPKLHVDKAATEQISGTSNAIFADVGSLPVKTTVAIVPSSEYNFADFSNAFSSKSCDEFGDFTSNSTNNAITTSSRLTNFLPHGSSGEDVHHATVDKPVNKYAELRDLFSSESSSDPTMCSASSASNNATLSSVFAKSGQQSYQLVSSPQASVFSSNETVSVFNKTSQEQPTVFASQQNSNFGSQIMTSQSPTIVGFGAACGEFGNMAQSNAASSFVHTQVLNVTPQENFTFAQQLPTSQTGSFGFPQQPSGTLFHSPQCSATSGVFGNQSSGFVSNPQHPFSSSSSTSMINPFVQSSQSASVVPNSSNPFVMQQPQAYSTNPFIGSSKNSATNSVNPFF